MQFDSHVERLLDVAVALVNLASPGEARGTAYDPPAGADLVQGVADATSTPERRSRPTAEQAGLLVEIVPRVREVFAAAARDDLVVAAGTVNELLATTEARPRLDPDEQGRFQLHFHGPDDGYARGWRAGLASGLAVALGSDLGGRLGVCDAPASTASMSTGRRTGLGGSAHPSARAASRLPPTAPAPTEPTDRSLDQDRSRERSSSGARQGVASWMARRRASAAASIGPPPRFVGRSGSPSRWSQAHVSATVSRDRPAAQPGGRGGGHVAVVQAGVLPVGGTQIGSSVHGCDAGGLDGVGVSHTSSARCP